MSQRKSAAGLLVLALGLILEQNARAICAAPAEEGRWRNLTNTGEPSLIDVRMLGCNDQGENGRIRYTMRAWVRQSSGQFYGRPTVDAEYRTWNAKRWMYGRIPTGGYVDHMWLRTENRDGQRQLHVLIKHESLDRKPSATSEFWFRH
jgi:hypothetical protein